MVIQAKKVILKDKNGAYLIPVMPDTVQYGIEMTVGARSNLQDQIDGKLDASTTIYEFVYDPANSNPSSCITYPAGSVNANFQSAAMNYSSGVFNYGDWKHTWIMNKFTPCMVFNTNESGRNGEIMEFLDPDDYTKQIDGTPSHVADTTCNANAMMRIGQIWIKCVTEDSKYHFYIANNKVNDDYKCWTHYNASNQLDEYYYRALYDAGVVDGTVRSLSGIMPYASVAGGTQITNAKANGTGWDVDEVSFRGLMQILLMLIGKSTDTQTVFGKGNMQSYVSDSNTGVLQAGTLNAAGMFFGYNTDKSAVKVFGMENLWGNVWKLTEGLIAKSGKIYIKLTPNTADGSVATAYNTNGTDYVDTGVDFANFSAASGGFISSMMPYKNVMIPTNNQGSNTTYGCDGCWFNTSLADGFARFGASSLGGFKCGAFALDLGGAVGYSWWYCGCSLSFKP